VDLPRGCTSAQALRRERMIAQSSGHAQPLPLHLQSMRLREGRAFSSNRRSRQPNLAIFAVASVAAGLGTFLFLESQVWAVGTARMSRHCAILWLHTWLPHAQDTSKPVPAGRGLRLPDLIYREAEPPAQPNPLRVSTPTPCCTPLRATVCPVGTIRLNALDSIIRCGWRRTWRSRAHCRRSWGAPS
jgi:hypothetical protein